MIQQLINHEILVTDFLHTMNIKTQLMGMFQKRAQSLSKNALPKQLKTNDIIFKNSFALYILECRGRAV